MAPPSLVTSEAKPDPLGPYVGAVNSETSAVLNPTASRTITVHDTASPSLSTVVVRVKAPIHESIDERVAMATRNTMR